MESFKSLRARAYLQVAIRPSTSIHFEPHLKHDGYEHASLEELSETVHAQGYTGGLHLLLVDALAL